MVNEYSLINAYQAVNRSVKNVLDSLVSVIVFDVPEPYENKVRLTESTFDVAERMERIAPVVTAHDLSQYINRFYSLELGGADNVWLDYLIEESEDSYLGGIT